MIRRALLALLLTIYATTPAVAAACATACAVPDRHAIGAETMDCHGAAAAYSDDTGGAHLNGDDGADGSSSGDVLMQSACAFAASAAMMPSPIEMSAAVGADRVSGAPLSPLSLSTPPPGEPPRG